MNDLLKEADIDNLLKAQQQQHPLLRDLIDKHTQSDALGPKIMGAATVIPMALSQVSFRHPPMTNVPL